MTLVILDGTGLKAQLLSRQLVIKERVTDESTGKKKTVTKGKVALLTLTGLIVGKRTAITTPAILALLRHGIPIFWMDWHWLIGVTHSFHSHGTVLVRRNQFLAINDSRGTTLMKGFVIGGLENKITVLRAFLKNRRESSPEVATHLEDVIQLLRSYHGKVKGCDGAPDEIRAELMGFEGQITKIYYSGLFCVLPTDFQVKGRSKRPPKDPVNAALSYGYAILYARAFIATCLTGLDPYGGFLHVDRSGRPSLAIDITEEFRQAIIDRTVITLCTKKQLDPIDHFQKSERGVLLNPQGKGIVVQAITEKMTSRFTGVDGVNRSYETALLYQTRKIARFLLKQDTLYKPFKGPL